ncbi:unnamed protein product, partial [Oppiella nova]
MKAVTLRWHTYRVIIVTSLLWCILCVCVILYYMDCLLNNNISCRNPLLLRTKTETNRQHHEHHERLQSNLINSEVHDFNTLKSMFSVTYKPEELSTWAPVETNKTNPVKWLGEFGKGVNIGPEELDLKNELFEVNKFNLLASDRIAFNRSIPDVRLEGCKHKSYPKLLPTTSVIIVFHNEAWSTFIIQRSPKSLLKEIILVDDASERDFLGKQLEEYVSKLPVRVIVLRTGKRSGLIRARLIGAKEAKGQVITFLDAHCECTKGWLEPLLSRIVEDRTRIACPIIDVINDETFEYTPASDMTWGGFSWKLNFRWFRIPKREMKRRAEDRTQPIRSPTMAGGLFAMDKQYFELLGKYDEGMEIWGGENLELSFRVWMCGGSLEIVTCSHVGH